MISVKHITGDLLVHTGAAIIRSFGLNDHGSASGHLKVYDGTDAGGTLLATLYVPSDASHQLVCHCALQGAPVSTSIFVDATDSAAGFSATIVYEEIS